MLSRIRLNTDAGSQYTAVRFSERLAEAGISASVGSVGDSFDNALAETINGLYKTELIKPRGPWRTVEQVEYATAEWVDWSTIAGYTSTAGTSRQPNWRPPTTVNTSPAFRSGAQKQSDRTCRCDSHRVPAGSGGRRARAVGGRQAAPRSCAHATDRHWVRCTVPIRFWPAGLGQGPARPALTNREHMACHCSLLGEIGGTPLIGNSRTQLNRTPDK